jgi:hypothetical protein
MSLIVEPEIHEEIAEIVSSLMDYHDDNNLEHPDKLNIRSSNQLGMSYRAILYRTGFKEYRLVKLRYLKR